MLLMSSGFRLKKAPRNVLPANRKLHIAFCTLCAVYDGLTIRSDREVPSICTLHIYLRVNIVLLFASQYVHTVHTVLKTSRY